MPNLRPSGLPYNPTPTAQQCELWSYVPHGDGLYHRQCPSLATRDSIVPGRIRLHVCEACYKRREEEAGHGG